MHHHIGMSGAFPEPLLTINGSPVAALPRCSGMYRFFDDRDALLYVGKSLDLRSRLRGHYRDAVNGGRQRRMMRMVHRVDCRPTAGELGALLLESEAIKMENPRFNRRLRRLRRLWTLALEEDRSGFLQPSCLDFAPDGERLRDTFGLYGSRYHLEKMLRGLARDHGLCLRVLGLDRGRGPCFQHQLRRCRGACAGRESARSHNRRLLDLLGNQRIAAWPFSGPVLLDEAADEACEHRPPREWHVVNHWAYLGTFAELAAARRVGKKPEKKPFDRDAYQLLVRSMCRGGTRLVDPTSARELANPFQGVAP